MEQYLPQTVNGKLSAINAYLHCMKLEQYCLRYLRISRKLFLSEQKELSLPEYERLLKCAYGSVNCALSRWRPWSRAMYKFTPKERFAALSYHMH